MPVYNFRCNDCKTLKTDVYFSLSELPKHIACSQCSGQMEQDYSQHIVGYSDNGYPYTDPQTGMTYTSANDKKQKLKMMGYEEADWKDGGAPMGDIHLHEAWKQEKEGKKMLGNSYWLDDDKSIEAQTDEIIAREGDKLVDKSIKV
jgi:predicted nucleic acid-binding Zn ribbon protein